MKEITINDCFDEIRNGANIKQGVVDGGYPITRIETISNDKFNRDRMGYAGITEIDKYNKYVLEDGDILMSHINSVQYLGRSVLYKKENEEKIIHGMNLLRLKPKREIIYPSYIKYYFYSRKFRDSIAKITKKSVNQASFAVKDLKEIALQLPSIQEQTFVATTLGKIEDIISLRNKELHELDHLIKSRFIEMFGDPVINDKEWPLASVIDECDCMVPGRDKPKSFTGNVPWITIDDLVVNGRTIASNKGLGLTEEEISSVKRKKVPKGSVLMSCVGNLGICSIADTDLIINQQLHSFQCGDNVCNNYLMHYLGYRTDYMNKHASSTTVLYMNKSVCNSIPLMLPPMHLQQEFSSFVQHVDRLKLEVKKSLEETQRLFDSLMQKYFE